MDETAVREFLSCPACRRDCLTPVAFTRDTEGMVDGVLACEGCRAWYRVEDRVPELLLPPLANEERRRAFLERFRGKWDGWEAASTGVDGPATGLPAAGGVELKLEQSRFFREHAAGYDRGMTDSPFWTAVDDRFLETVAAECPRGGILVEAGAGTGRRTAELASRFSEVFAFDLSEEMTREALRKRSGHGPGRVHRFVADAERVPLRSGLADCWAFRGVLAYLASPDKAVAEAVRVLRGGGVLLGYENNRSAFRPAFDLIAHVFPGWREKSLPGRAMVRRADLEGWLSAAGVSGETWTRVFLPPQLFNLAGVGAASRLMWYSDANLAYVPWLGRQGGLLFFAGRKAAN